VRPQFRHAASGEQGACLRRVRLPSGVRFVAQEAALHNFDYLFYDVAGAVPVRDWVARGEDLDKLWSYAATDDAALMQPALADDLGSVDAAALAAVCARRPQLSGQALVRKAFMWREVFDWPRERFTCGGEALEYELPGDSLGRDNFSP
jgi:hypothetical protein